METVTVSPKYQVVIPQSIRRELNIKAGEKMAVLRIGKTIYFVPVGPIKELKGFVKGISTRGVRDERDRFD